MKVSLGSRLAIPQQFGCGRVPEIIKLLGCRCESSFCEDGPAAELRAHLISLGWSQGPSDAEMVPEIPRELSDEAGDQDHLCHVDVIRI